ncbi:MAG: NhaA family Na+:H+ antiporter [Candidatus Poriferisodalaceae bacterium]|jgi:NhaA family Na+:H+ antiporter
MTNVPGPATPRRRPLPAAVRRFMHTEAAGGVVLLFAAVIALVWANSTWRSGYVAMWETKASLGIGDLTRSEDLRHIVNEALMALFFLVVGLEIKRELVTGQLSQWRNAAVPALAALGGMVVPAAIYAAFNNGSAGSDGWGIPMARDIAFALGVVAVLGRRVPPSLRIFLLTLAIVDDIGAIVVIAVFYSSSIAWPALGAAAALLAATIALRVAKVGWLPAYLAVGIGMWLAFYESGIHATLAGVILGLLTPARPAASPALAVEIDATDSEPVSDSDVVSVAERLQHQLHPLTSFVVVPLFALANAGVEFRADALDAEGAGAVATGVGAGLIGGKIIGVTGFTWLATRLGLGPIPRGSTWPQVVGISAVAGIGFTVSLFIAGLAFPDPGLEAAAKIGILAASLIAALIGIGLLIASARSAKQQVQQA